MTALASGHARARQRGELTSRGRFRLGEVLVEQGLITEDQLHWALQVQRSTQAPLGKILLAAGVVSRVDLYRVLAGLWGAPFVDVAGLELDPDLGRDLDPERCVRELWVPVERRADGSRLVATAAEPTVERRRCIEEALGGPVELAVTTEWDIDYALRQICRDQVLDAACHGLWRQNESHSARRVLSRTQVVMLGLAFVAVSAAFGLWPRVAVAVASATVAGGFLLAVAFKFVVCLVGAYHEPLVGSPREDDHADLADADLPMYTVLVPCFREANVVGQLVENLSAIDYPAEKLEILLLLEEDDAETWEAAEAACPPATVTFVTVPRGQPQTKPKACNVGLLFARGEYLVIYDAEDRPEPEQLKKAVAAFRRGGDDLVCVQAALNYFNANENALTKMFTLEYSFWFDYMLPGLSALRLPIPLGGTSNHFRTEELRLLGGWDPYNVTEDADLGIRASALGKRVGVIDSTTFEEANKAYGNFVRQRSRWIKGYLQTTLVHLRHPVQLVRAAGWRQLVSFVALIAGTPLAFLSVPPLYVLTGVSLCLPPATLAPFYPHWVLWLSLVDFMVGNGLMVYVSMMGVLKRHQHRIVLWSALNPLYWLLHATAAYKALWQLVVRPHYWEKTAHGLTTHHPSS